MKGCSPLAILLAVSLLAAGCGQPDKKSEQTGAQPDAESAKQTSLGGQPPAEPATQPVPATEPAPDPAGEMKVPEVEITGPEMTPPANLPTEPVEKPAAGEPIAKPVEKTVEDPFKEEPLPEDNE